jgi:hypothetical protein
MMMVPISYGMPRNLLATWPQIFTKRGLIVRILRNDPEAVGVAKYLLGPMWCDEFLKTNLGGLVVRHDAIIWIQIHEDRWGVGLPSLPDKQCEVLIGFLPPKKIMRSRRERRLLREVTKALIDEGILPIPKHLERPTDVS